jgi:hypothetical protein
LPFTGEPGAVLQAQVDKPLPHPRTFRSDLSDAFCRVLQKMLDKDPRRRHQSYEELCADLNPLRGGDLADTNDQSRPGSLLFADGPLTGRKIVLPMGDFVVGREVDCQLVIDDPQSSRRHAAFTRGVDGLSVRDLGSRNGVLVNTARVPQAQLRVGDLVQIGSTTFKILAAPVSREMSALRPPSVNSHVSESRVAFLARLARVLTGTNPGQAMQKVLPELLEGRPELMPIGRLVLVRWASGQAGQVVMHEARTAADAVPPLTTLLQQVCLSGRGVTFPDARTEPKYASESPKVAFVVCSPLVHRGQVLGAIYADSLSPQQVTPAEASFFEAVGHLVATAVRG